MKYYVNHVLRLAHAVRHDERLRDLAQAAMADRDGLLAEVRRLERELAAAKRDTPKFQGMTELA